MAYEIEQPNYFDYLETRFNESLSSDNLKMVQSLTPQKFTDLIATFTRDRSLYDFFSDNFDNKNEKSKILFPYAFKPARHDEFCPLFTPRHFGFIAQILNWRLSAKSVDIQNQIANTIKKTLLLSHSITLPSSIESLFISTPKYIMDSKSLFPDYPSKLVEDACKKSIATHLNLIFQFKELIKSNILKFLPVNVLMDSRYSLLKYRSNTIATVEKLEIFAKKAEVELPAIKKNQRLSKIPQNQHYLNILYPNLAETQEVSKILSATCCIGQKRYIPLLKLLNDYHISNSSLYLPKRFEEGSKFRENFSLLNLLNSTIPKLDELPVDDIINIRLNSEYFNTYREQLKKGLSDIESWAEPDVGESIKTNMLIAQENLKSAFRSTSVISKLSKDKYSIMIGAFLSGGISLAFNTVDAYNANLNNKGAYKAATNHCALWLE